MNAPESPAETLRSAAALMREREPDSKFFGAVATWLAGEGERAVQIDSYTDSAAYPLMLDGYRHPLAVARAFLCEQVTRDG